MIQAPETSRPEPIGRRAAQAALYSRASLGYRAPRPGVRVPANGGTPKNTIADYVIRALYPWENIIEYPGRVRGMIRLFQHRVTGWAVVKWRLGKRRMPTWALGTALIELRKRRDTLQHAIDLCEVEIAKRKAPD